jgi:enolase
MPPINSRILAIKGIELLDSRGFPTVAAVIHLESGVTGMAYVPSGASTGEHEAHELRDGGKRYLGKGVSEVVKNINGSIAKRLIGTDVLRLKELDQALIELDGTENKSRLGANSLLAVSLASAHAGANLLQIPLYAHLGGLQARRLPTPLVNVINGGAHASNAIDFQEFMLVPVSGNTFGDNLRMAAEVFHTLKKNLKKSGFQTGLGDEGGFAPDLPSVDSVLQTLVDAITDAGYQPGADIGLALDVAASEFFDKEKGAYTFKKSTKETLTSREMIQFYVNLKKGFPLLSIEDGLDENDWGGWRELTEELGSTTQLVGDDLFVTNKKRLAQGLEAKVGNSILVKLNQIGTVTETLETIQLAQQNGYTSIISHRSGETEDSSIADLSVAVNAGQIKTGSVCRGERTAKYNRLLIIEEELGKHGFIQSPFLKA